MEYKTTLPPVSTSAFKDLKPEEQANGVKHEQEQSQPTFKPEPALVLTALQNVATADENGVLVPTPDIPSIGAMIVALKANKMTAEDAVDKFRQLCSALINVKFSDDLRGARVASYLLDIFNTAVDPTYRKKALRDLLPKPPADEAAQANGNGNAAAAGPSEGASLLPPSDPQVQKFLAIKTEETGSGRGGRGRGRGRGRGGKTASNAAPGGAQKRRAVVPSPWTKAVQAELSIVLREAIKQPDAPPLSEEQLKESLQPIMINLLTSLKAMNVCDSLRNMGATFNHCLATLQVGGYTEIEDFRDALKVEAHQACEAFIEQSKTDMRRGKVIAQAEQFVNIVGASIENVLAELRELKKYVREAEAEAQGVEEDEIIMQELRAEFLPAYIPPTIKNNNEPYRNGEWRKTPFSARPYVRLSEYFIVEDATREVIQRKLSTEKTGGCDGEHCGDRNDLGTYSLENEGFVTHCACLAKNTECDAKCQCDGKGTCLNRSVTARATVKLGEDVEEVNSWGMDCYTRRNIQDAVLESQAYGPYKMRSYGRSTRSDPAVHAATAAGQHAQVANVGSPSAPSPHANTTTEGTENEEAPQLTEKEQRAIVEHAVVEWLERKLIPAVNRQGDHGWDILLALAEVKAKGEAAGDMASVVAAEAVTERVHMVGYNYFRIHPKGVGLVCKRDGGLPRLTFVEEYLGEIHTPWRWFELQDAVKKITGDELPDFYNILLERPKDDPGGYDVLFVDAAAKGALASRMSHSCTPNCQAVVMACGGRLTIALYTLRHVYEGEELTFDYSSVTESEKEFREAICLCGTAMCRGSYLYFTGSRAFQQVMSEKHAMLHRQAILARAGAEPVTQADLDRVKAHGLGSSALGSVEHGDRVPDWLLKWTALICEYLELEESCLKQELLSQPHSPYNELTATAEAKGVISNRLQNIVITLDKVKMFLAHPGQPQGPPLRSLTDKQVVEHLWSDHKSIARRMLRGIASKLAPMTLTRNIVGSNDNTAMELAIADARPEMPSTLVKVCDIVLSQADTVDEVKAKLFELVDVMRDIDVEVGGGLTAAADILYLYASTRFWITSERGYTGHTSPPVPINLKDLFLNRETTQLAPTATNNAQQDEEKLLAEQKVEEAAARKARVNAKNPALRKKYNSSYVWGQLNGWFKQTVNDPTASLSAERRGTLSLPDVESAFSGKGYGMKERNEMVYHIQHNPHAMWRTGTLWSFKNEAKVYGSPMLDAAWLEIRGEQDQSPLPTVVATLNQAKIPALKPATGRQPGQRKGGKKRKGGFDPDDFEDSE